MPTKRIICLACSTKSEVIAPGDSLHGRCVAGLDIDTGQWVRPVSTLPNGTLSKAQCRIRGNALGSLLPTALDVLEIEFLQHAPKTGQPENWIISETPWKCLRPATPSDLAVLNANIEDDAELFRGYESSLTHEEVLKRPPLSSLALIRPSDLRWEKKTGYYQRPKVLGHFKVGGQGYSLTLTDPIWKQKLLVKLGDTLLEHRKCFDHSSKDYLLSLSLGDFFPETGDHHKLIAGVIEIPESTI